MRYHLVSCLDDAFLQTKRSFARYHLPKSQNVYFFWFQSCPCGFPFSKFSSTWVLGLPKFSFVCFLSSFSRKIALLGGPQNVFMQMFQKAKGKIAQHLIILRREKWLWKISHRGRPYSIIAHQRRVPTGLSASCNLVISWGLRHSHQIGGSRCPPGHCLKM